MALIQCFEGDFDGSLQSFQGLVDQHPTAVDVRYDMAMTQMMLGMVEEACTNFRTILNQQPDHEKARKQLVYCQ